MMGLYCRMRKSICLINTAQRFILLIFNTQWDVCFDARLTDSYSISIFQFLPSLGSKCGSLISIESVGIPCMNETTRHDNCYPNSLKWLSKLRTIRIWKGCCWNMSGGFHDVQNSFFFKAQKINWQLVSENKIILWRKGNIKKYRRLTKFLTFWTSLRNIFNNIFVFK